MVQRIFIVDDHRLIRESYAKAIEETAGLSACGTAASFAEALEALPAARPNVALVDVALVDVALVDVALVDVALVDVAPPTASN